MLSIDLMCQDHKTIEFLRRPTVKLTPYYPTKHYKFNSQTKQLSEVANKSLLKYQHVHTWESI